MKLVIKWFLLLNMFMSVSYAADRMNFYLYLYNVSTKYKLSIEYGGRSNWDNNGWDQCTIPNNIGDKFNLNNSEMKLFCGGTTNSSSMGWVAYDIVVTDKNNVTINKYSHRFAAVVQDWMGSHISLKNRTGYSDGGDWINFTGYHDKDVVVVYVLGDNGLTTTVGNAGFGDWNSQATHGEVNLSPATKCSNNGADRSCTEFTKF